MVPLRLTLCQTLIVTGCLHHLFLRKDHSTIRQAKWDPYTGTVLLWLVYVLQVQAMNSAGVSWRWSSERVMTGTSHWYPYSCGNVSLSYRLSFPAQHLTCMVRNNCTYSEHNWDVILLPNTSRAMLQPKVYFVYSKPSCRNTVCKRSRV